MLSITHENVYINQIHNAGNVHDGRNKFTCILNKLIEKGLIEEPLEYPFNTGHCEGYYSFKVKFKNKPEISLVTVRGTDVHPSRVQVNYRMIEHTNEMAKEMGFNHVLICYFIKHKKLFIIHNPLLIKKYKNGGDTVYLSMKRLRSL